eukprot:305929-Chlamydomonas_euryale.AAC.1
MHFLPHAQEILAYSFAHAKPLTAHTRLSHTLPLPLSPPPRLEAHLDMRGREAAVRKVEAAAVILRQQCDLARQRFERRHAAPIGLNGHVELVAVVLTPACTVRCGRRDLG